MYVLFPWSDWDLLPEPQTDWEAASWILGAIGDVNFQQVNDEAGRDILATGAESLARCLSVLIFSSRQFTMAGNRRCGFTPFSTTTIQTVGCAICSSLLTAPVALAGGKSPGWPSRRCSRVPTVRVASSSSRSGAGG
jgi:hypothetical protein